MQLTYRSLCLIFVPFCALASFSVLISDKAFSKEVDSFKAKGQGYLPPSIAQRIYRPDPKSPPVWEDPTIPPRAYTLPVTPQNKIKMILSENRNASQNLAEHTSLAHVHKDIAKLNARQESLEDRRIIALENQAIESGMDPAEAVSHPEALYQVAIAQRNSARQRAEETDVISSQEGSDSKQPETNQEQIASVGPETLGQRDPIEERREFTSLFSIEPIPAQFMEASSAADQNEGHEHIKKGSLHVMEIDENGHPKSVALPAPSSN